MNINVSVIFSSTCFSIYGGAYDISGKNPRKVDVKFYIPLKIPSVPLRS
jgi:hypothetical protein